MAGLVFHGYTNEWVNPDELHLHVLPIKGHPLPLDQLLYHDSVNCVILDCVVSWRTSLTLLVVRDALHLQKET